MGSFTDTKTQRTPSYHFTAPHGWMNDPCGPGYDPTTGKYHLFYQWNPHSCEWGNISWGHATSTDLVHWEHHSTKDKPALSPVDSYDKEGVFTGCFLPQGINGESGELSLIYSSINYLPIHWTIPYVRGCEGIAIATSKDAGVSWHKLSANPVLEEEPQGLDVTGFRDPYIAAWPALDELHGCGKTLYGVVSGGIRGKGPAAFLYAISPRNLTKWYYLGPVLETPENLRTSAKWSGDCGVNWECAGFMTLQSEDGKSSKDFIVTGTEGGKERPWVKSYLANKPSEFPRRTTRYGIWIAGSPNVSGTTLSLSHDFDGMLDHGCFYAANTFFDPVKQRRVLWGWLPEEDVPIEHCRGKGWNGCLGIPRELFLYKASGVIGALRSKLRDITSIQIAPDACGESYAIETLGVKPLSDLAKLRTGEAQVLKNLSLPSNGATTLPTALKGKRWELEATLTIREGCSGVGVMLKHNQDQSVATTIRFLPDLEEFVVDRSKSNTSTEINKCDERGSFTLFKTRAGSNEEIEKLHLRVFCDEDVLEIFANERFALSTMVYTDDPEALGVSLCADGQDDSARFEEVRFWQEMSDIFR